MIKITSKKTFIEKLRFYLSFYFNEEESISILNDYEEWFDNEALQGKSEEVICAALNSPKNVVNHLLLESNRSPARIHILFQNAMIQGVLLIMMHFLISILILKTCSRNSLSYLYIASGIIFIDFIVELILIKKKSFLKPSARRRDFYRSNFPVLFFSVAVILSEIFFLPKMNHPNSGEICCFVLSALILILVLINIYIIIKKIFEAPQSAYFTTLHISGTITLLFYIINQLHMMYQNMSEFLNLIIWGSIALYIETIILCFIFYLIGKTASDKRFHLSNGIKNMENEK